MLRMFGKPLPRWFYILGLLLLILRISYKYHRTQHKPDYKAQMEAAEGRQQALIKAIEADQAAQRANGAVVIRADSTVWAADSATQAK